MIQGQSKNQKHKNMEASSGSGLRSRSTGKDTPRLQPDKRSQSTQKSLIHRAYSQIKAIVTNQINTSSNQRSSSFQKPRPMATIIGQHIRQQDKQSQQANRPVAKQTSPQQNTKNTNEVTDDNTSQASDDSFHSIPQDFSPTSQNTSNSPGLNSSSQEPVSNKQINEPNRAQEHQANAQKPGHSPQESGIISVNPAAIYQKVTQTLRQSVYSLFGSSSSSSSLIDTIPISNMYESTTQWIKRAITYIQSLRSSPNITKTQSISADLVNQLLAQIKQLKDDNKKIIQKLQSLQTSNKSLLTREVIKNLSAQSLCKQLGEACSKIKEIPDTISNQTKQLQASHRKKQQKQMKIIERLDKDLKLKNNQQIEIKKQQQKRQEGNKKLNKKMAQQIKSHQTSIAQSIKQYVNDLINGLADKFQLHRQKLSIHTKISKQVMKHLQVVISNHQDSNRIVQNYYNQQKKQLESHQEQVCTQIKNIELTLLQKIHRESIAISSAQKNARFQFVQINKVLQQNSQSLASLTNLQQQIKDDGSETHQMLFCINSSLIQTHCEVEKSLPNKIENCLKNILHPHFKSLAEYNRQIYDSMNQNNQIICTINSHIRCIEKNVTVIQSQLPQYLSPISSGFAYQSNLLAQISNYIKDQSLIQSFNQLVKDFAGHKIVVSQISAHLKSQKLSDLLSQIQTNLTQQNLAIKLVQTQIKDQNIPESLIQIKQSLSKRENVFIQSEASNIRLIAEDFKIYINTNFIQLYRQLFQLKSQISKTGTSNKLPQIHRQHQQQLNQKIQHDHIPQAIPSSKITFRNVTHKSQSIFLASKKYQTFEQINEVLNDLEKQKQQQKISPTPTSSLSINTNIITHTVLPLPYSSNNSIIDQSHINSEKNSKEYEIQEIHKKKQQYDYECWKYLAEVIIQHLKPVLKPHLIQQKFFLYKGIFKQDPSNCSFMDSSLFKKSSEGLVEKNELLINNSRKIRKGSQNLAENKSKYIQEGEPYENMTDSLTEVNLLRPLSQNKKDKLSYISGSHSSKNYSDLHSRIQRNYRNDQRNIFNNFNSQRSLQQVLNLHQNDTISNPNDTILHRNDTILHRNDSILHRNDSILHRNDSILHRNDTILHRNDTILHQNHAKNSLSSDSSFSVQNSELFEIMNEKQMEQGQKQNDNSRIGLICGPVYVDKSLYFGRYQQQYMLQTSFVAEIELNEEYEFVDEQVRSNPQKYQQIHKFVNQLNAYREEWRKRNKNEYE